MTTSSKTCTKCGNTKPRADFHRDAAKPDGLQYWCRACHQDRNRARRATLRGRAYESWHNARVRCTNPTHRAWPHYGGRGVTMCPEWLDSFDAFYVVMGGRPEGLTLDRINNDGNYEPGNVRWATPKEQAANRRPRAA